MKIELIKEGEPFECGIRRLLLPVASDGGRGQQR